MKKHKIESLYLAVSLADRYLAFISAQCQKCPNLVTLAVICVLLAAKLEEPVSPSFDEMLDLIDCQSNLKLSKKDLIDLEESILRAL